MIFGLYDDYFMLKVIILLLFISLIINTRTLFYRLYKDRQLKGKKENTIVRITSLLDSYLEEDGGNVSQNALNEIRHSFTSDKYFSDLLICELRKHVANDEKFSRHKKLYYLLDGPKVTHNKLMSKDPILVYQGLQETDRFDLLSEKEVLSRLQRHHDIRISLLASCILFKYKDEIKVDDILNLESILCPMVEIKVFNEFIRHHQSSHAQGYITEVLNNCLKLDISDKMRFFLEKSLKTIET